MKSRIALLAAPLFLIACGKTVPEQPGQDKELVLTAVEQQKAGKDNQFAFELFHKAVAALENHQNAFLSPLSISMALAMTNNGAAGETREAIEKTLKLDGFDTEAINTYYRKIMTDLPALDPKATLSIANSIWYRQGFEVLQEFLDINRSYYEAEIAALNFADPGAPEIINDWVSAETRDKIPKIVDDIPDGMVMYLINAVYFKGEWEQRFDPSETSESDFHTQSDASLQTDFMHLTDTFNVAVTEGVEAIELPYGNKKYRMVVLKPREGSSPAQLAEKLAGTDVWHSIIDALRTRKTRLSLPKFKFSYENVLNDELSGLGMGIAFSKRANFTGINQQENLAISRVKHKSFIEVNEEGMEAAAATSVGIEVTSGRQIYTLRVDRPFVFVIREINTGLILFIGQVNDPSVKKSEA